MGWLLAFAIIAVAVATLVGGAVLRPVLYGIIIAAALVVPIWLVYSAIDGVIDIFFGKRR